MRGARRLGLAAAAAAAATGLAACDMVDNYRYPYAQEDADTVFLDAVKATTALDSVRVSGSLDPKGSSTFSFNVMSVLDKGCGGTVSFSTADFDLVQTREGDYLKGSASSWQQLPGHSAAELQAVSGVLEDRWVKLTRGKAGFDLNPICTISRLLTDDERKAVDAGKVPSNLEVTSKGLSEAAGEKAVKLQVVEDDESTDVWVSLEEPHYILKLTGTDKNGTVEVVFSDFDFPAPVEAPEAKDMVDLAKLTDKGKGKG